MKWTLSFILLLMMFSCGENNSKPDQGDPETTAKSQPPSVRGLEVVVTTAEGIDGWIGSGTFLLQNPSTQEQSFSLERVQLQYKGQNTDLDTFYVYSVPSGGELEPQALSVSPQDSLELNITFPARRALPYSQEPTWLDCVFVVGEQRLTARSEITVEVEFPER